MISVWLYESDGDCIREVGFRVEITGNARLNWKVDWLAACHYRI